MVLSWKAPSLFFILLSVILGFGENANGLCGYPSCPGVKEGMLNVHLVPHSHDDIGWLKTVDQYYYGDKNKIQLAAVQYTIDSVVEQLQKSPNRRFIYVETGFFWRWWTNQDEDTKAIVKGLVSSGQLEFISGGWVMNDEAATHYNAIIDQMGLGLRFLNETFGECGVPRVAWQIDPFGHSREQASLFAQMGFDGLFFGRLDYQDKYFRRVGKNMEMIWEGSPNNLGTSSSLFTGVLYNGYNPPDGFCFDIFCEDDPINDDPKLYDYNLDEKVNAFIKISKEWNAPYKSDNVLMTMGSDFQYMAAHTWYKNLDKLIKHVNHRQTNGSKVNLIYSTPSCYLQEVNKAKPILKSKTDDFFPYASDPHAFWTGYFTSRPTLKYFVHKTNNFLQACKQITLGGYGLKVDQGVLDQVWSLSEALAILQHHDAVSGTAKQHVTNDYGKRLSFGVGQCEVAIKRALRILFNKGEKGHQNKELNGFSRQKKERSFEFCHQLNTSSCPASERMGDFTVSVYNPLARELKDEYVRLPVPDPSWTVRGVDGLLPTQSVVIPQDVLSIPGRDSSAQYELIFKASTLQGLSFTNFQVTRDQITSQRVKNQIKPVKRSGSKDNGDFWVQNKKNISILFDGSTGLLKKIRKGNTEQSLTQNFYFYPGMRGNNSKFEFRASGAYIFRPNGSQPVQLADKVTYAVYEGQHVTEVHQTFAPWLSQIVRLYDEAESVEFEWLVGPIPTDDGIGKEIITRFSSDLNTKGIFYTDSNGRELLKRKRDFRPTWNYKVYEAVSGNYYPVNSRLIISEDENFSDTSNAPTNGNTLILLNDRAQGGTSMNDGEIEIMIHRRLLDDDAFGVGEALNESAYGTGLVARGRHWLVFAGGETGFPTSIHRPLAQKIFMDKILTFSEASESYSFMNSITPTPDLTTKQSILTKLSQIIPDNIHVLTLEPVSPDSFILRLEHFYEVGESEEYSKPVSISVQSLKKILPLIKFIRETTLGGNQWKSDSKRFEWISERGPVRDGDNNPEDPDVILLKPMEIKSFIVRV